MLRCTRLAIALLVSAVFSAPSFTQVKPMSTPAPTNAPVARPAWLDAAMAKLELQFVAKYGDAQRARLRRGLKQVAQFWRNDDGNQAAFEEFVTANFAGDQQTLDAMFRRFEHLFEQLDGHMQEITREFRTHTDLDLGKILPIDEIFAAYDPTAHLNDDFFKNKLAFAVLLNFPLTTLEERLANGPGWSRRQWAEVRLAQRFTRRVPAAVNLAIAQAISAGERYISDYNIWMHHLVDDRSTRLFPPKLCLLAHWNLRDQIKADYADTPNGLARQRTIQQVMERIVTQTIPAVVVNNPAVDWNPFTNAVQPAAVQDSDAAPAKSPTNQPEPDARYAALLAIYQAQRQLDPYAPTAPTLIARRFDENREIPERRVEAMLEQVVSSPLVPRVAKLIQQRLGRPLEPFDIWYNGFRARSKNSEAELDQIVARKYPTPDAFRQDIPNLLVQLGFAPAHARVIAVNIIVDPARGSGHAMGAAMRQARAHLRTRVPKTGMNYKGYNIAIHELGHNVEQTLSLNEMDHFFLNGVPNTAFTEALAFVFQAQDLKLLGLQVDDPRADALKTLNDFWATYEIAGVALVDMKVWHWMYDHPDATAADLKRAAIQISKDIWNRYYAPVFGTKDVVLLGVYSHMISSVLYLPDYPMGHLIAHQIEEQMRRAGKIGPEFERVVKPGSILPDLWMKNATGKPVGPDALLEATERALKEMGA
jgi:hypothetical protein